MKSVFLVYLFLLSTIGFSQSEKNKKQSFNIRVVTDVNQVDLIPNDTISNNKSVFLRLKDSIGYVSELKVPVLVVSDDLSVYSVNSKKKKKKSNSLSGLLLQMQLQQQVMFHQQQMMQVQQQAQRTMQQNMMNMPKF